MNTWSPEDIRNALRSVKYPGYSRDIVSFGLVQDIRVEGERVHVVLHLNSPNTEAGQRIREESQALLESLPGVREAIVELIQPAASMPHAGPDPWAHQSRVPGVQRVLAVASGKGGVGKSTVAVNLACALQQLQRRVGLLDCDIYGPSIPLMMGVRERPTLSPREMLVPPVGHGVKLMSIGFLLEDDQPVIWRGPMIQKTIQQFLTVVEWGELDYLLVDLPPGTGDAQLSLCQSVPLDGGIIVTTPQAAAVGVVRKGIAMFQKVHVPIVGIIENMSYFQTPDGQRIEIFGHGGGQSEAARQGLPFLGEIPIYPEIREAGDRGLPVVVSTPHHPAAKGFIQIARTICNALEHSVGSGPSSGPGKA
ncbi:MAG: Mrp/NBP35 family ATP-binding protein [Verrucomicrobiota bacterium]|nr:Mrp/NBP35 family ATP-binding protein [Limisphaera sp.]MDW8381445.1 Mrp/NBP35 family ATP-binding protein [Verrucomicrobiota bacterium]